jgi:hypothetical protein
VLGNDHRVVNGEILSQGMTAIAIHLIICKPTLSSGRDYLRVFAGEALFGESAGLGGCTRLDRDGALRRLVPQRGQVLVWEDPGTEVRNNRVWFQVGSRLHQCGRSIRVEETRTTEAKNFQGAGSTAIEARFQGRFRPKRAQMG